MIIFWVLHMMLTPILMRRVRAALREYYTPAAALLLAPAVLNLVVQVLNVTGWFYESGFVPYLFGLLVYLYSAGVSFVYTVIFRPDESDSDA